MKIIFIIPSLSTGGAEKVVSTITDGLSLKFNITLLSFYQCDKEYFINKKIKRIVLAKDEKQYKTYSKIWKIKKIRNIIKNEQPDKIICFLNYVCIYTFISLLFSKYRKRIIFTDEVIK